MYLDNSTIKLGREWFLNIIRVLWVTLLSTHLLVSSNILYHLISIISPVEVKRNVCILKNKVYLNLEDKGYLNGEIR